MTMARTATKSTTVAKDATVEDTTEDPGTPVPTDTTPDPVQEDPSDNMTGDPRPVEPAEDTKDPAPGRPVKEDRPVEDDPEDIPDPVTFVYHLMDGTTVTQKAPPGINRRYAKDPGTVRTQMSALMAEGWVFVPSGQGAYSGDLINPAHIVKVEISR
jgi:hypothetical protein